MTITRTINGESISIELTEQEMWEVWKEMEEARDRSYIVGHIEENYDGLVDPEVYNLLQSDEVVDEIYEEAHFRAENGCGRFEAEADMLIESKLEELESEIDLTEEE